MKPSDKYRNISSEGTNPSLDKMNDYLDGKLTPEEMHAVESASLSNNLTAESLDSIEKLNERKSFSKNINRINQRIDVRTGTTTDYTKYKAAASVLLLSTLAFLLLWKPSSETTKLVDSNFEINIPSPKEEKTSVPPVVEIEETEGIMSDEIVIEALEIVPFVELPEELTNEIEALNIPKETLIEIINEPTTEVKNNIYPVIPEPVPEIIVKKKTHPFGEKMIADAEEMYWQNISPKDLELPVFSPKKGNDGKQVISKMGVPDITKTPEQKPPRVSKKQRESHNLNLLDDAKKYLLDNPAKSIVQIHQVNASDDEMKATADWYESAANFEKEEIYTATKQLLIIKEDYKLYDEKANEIIAMVEDSILIMAEMSVAAERIFWYDLGLQDESHFYIKNINSITTHHRKGKKPKSMYVHEPKPMIKGKPKSKKKHKTPRFDEELMLKNTLLDTRNHLEKNNPHQALILIRKVEESHNKDFVPTALWYKAMAHLQMGDLKIAKEILSQLISDKSDYKSYAEKILTKINQ